MNQGEEEKVSPLKKASWQRNVASVDIVGTMSQWGCAARRERNPVKSGGDLMQMWIR